VLGGFTFPFAIQACKVTRVIPTAFAACPVVRVLGAIEILIPNHLTPVKTYLKISLEQELEETMPERLDRNDNSGRGFADYVVCRECHGKFGTLVGGRSHLRSAHQMTKPEYLARWPGAPLISAAMEKRLSARFRGMWKSERAGHRPRRRVRGHQESSAPKWPMICLRVQGKSHREIGQAVNRTEVAIYHALGKVGLSGEPAIYDFGEACTASTLIRLKKATGLTASELAREADIPERQFIEATRPGRALNNRRVHPELARKLVAWRDKMLETFFGKPQTSRSADAIDKRKLLKTFIPDLYSSYDLVLSALRKLRKYLQSDAAQQSDKLQDYFCAQAESEVLEKRPGVFVKFLPWAPELLPLLESRRSRIAARESLPPLVHELIGARWNLSPSIVSEAMRSRTRRVPPKEMRYRIQALSRETPPPIDKKLRRQRGPRKMPDEQTVWFDIGRRVQQKIPNAQGIDDAALIAARKAIVAETHLQYESVVRYHRLYRKWLNRKAAQGSNPG
jgi:hypothetical protein